MRCTPTPPPHTHTPIQTPTCVLSTIRLSLSLSLSVSMCVSGPTFERSVTSEKERLVLQAQHCIHKEQVGGREGGA